MHKFLMVDDEDVIRTGFREKIDWAGLGFEFLEPCANGIQALEAVERFRPDVVMTDVCMPQMDGLELCRILARDHPEIKVVVLSGHDDFEYARESLRHRVLDYILKPLTSDELRSFLVKLKKLMGKSPGLSEAEAVRRLVEGTLAAEQLLPLDGDISSTWSEAWWTVGRLGLFYRSETEPSPAELVGRVETILARRIFPWPGLAAANVKHGGKVVHLDLLFPGNDPLKGSLRAHRESHRLLSEFRQAGFVGNGALSEPCQGSAGLPGALAEAVSDNLLRFVRSEPLSGGLGSRAVNTDPPGSLRPFLLRLETLIREGDRPAVDDFLKDFQQTLPRVSESAPQLRQELGALFAVLDPPDGVFGVDTILETCADGQDLVDALEARMIRALDRVSHRGASLADRAFRQFHQSITERFGNPDLSLEEVSRELQVSPSYLSKILRRRLSTNFSHYLREVRISKAKELLAGTDLTTTQIAEEIGFNDYRYFSNQFKRQVGTTPSGYRVRTRVST